MLHILILFIDLDVWWKNLLSCMLVRTVLRLINILGIAWRSRMKIHCIISSIGWYKTLWFHSFVLIMNAFYIFLNLSLNGDLFACFILILRLCFSSMDLVHLTCCLVWAIHWLLIGIICSNELIKIALWLRARADSYLALRWYLNCSRIMCNLISLLMQMQIWISILISLDGILHV